MCVIDKDRRTRMATSSVKAPAKKRGAGGQFTWGSTTEVDWYDPVGLAAVPNVGVVIAPFAADAACAEQVTALPMKTNIMDKTEFPTLGDGPAALLRTSTTICWAPVLSATSGLANKSAKAINVRDLNAPRLLKLSKKKKQGVTQCSREAARPCHEIVNRGQDAK